MEKHKLSVVIDSDLHKAMKIYCAQHQMTIKEFIIMVINNEINIKSLLEPKGA